MDINSLIFTKLSVTPWAIHPRMFDIFTSVFNNKLHGDIIRPEQVYDKNTKVNYQVLNSKAIIPVHGIVMKKSMGMEGASGIETTVNLENTLKAALDDKDVEEIILDIDSPGGTVDGTAEFADMIYAARGEKKIVAYANGLMASAAYWIASAASEIITSETSDIGSIGVYLMHMDQSEYNKDMGIKVTYIKAGKYKTIGNPHEPLTEESISKLQEEVDYIYSLFINAVARNRNLSVEDVIKAAEGQIFVGQQAINAKLADRIGSFDNVVTGSNIYSFLKGASMSKKVKEATVADLKEENVDLYNAVIEEGKVIAQEEISGLKTQLLAIAERKAEDEKIRQFASKLGLDAEGEQLVKEGKSSSEALESLLNKAAESKQNLKDAFEATAPKSAGGASSDELANSEPQNQDQAMKFCMKKYNCSKAEAWKYARRDFIQFFTISKEGKE